MMPDDHNSNGVEMDFEKNMVRKFLQIASTKSRRIEVVPLGVLKDCIESHMKVIPEPVA